MTQTKQSEGLSMLLCVFLLIGSSLSMIGIFQHLQIRQQLRSEILASEQIELNHIRLNLLQFAMSQGYNSLTDLGRLPCPSQTEQGNPEVACLKANVGYLPRTSHTATNYLNQTVAHQRSRNIETNIWMYAVSEQVLQPNSLGWSQKVDWSKPSLVVRVGDQLINDVVALVAYQITPQKDHLEVEGPYTVITQTQLLKHLRNHILQQVNATLTQLPSYASADQAYPFIDTSGEKPVAIDSSCHCRCTKTRCSCNCLADSVWQSQSPCQKGNSNCKTINQWLAEPTKPFFFQDLKIIDKETSICSSADGSPCVFKGPAQLLSEWGISAFKPVAAFARSCRPTHYATCPTSLNSSPCECFFGWPQTTKNDLGNLNLLFNQGRWSATW